MSRKVQSGRPVLTWVGVYHPRGRLEAEWADATAIFSLL
jgi:hypothetical protein